GQVLWEQHRLGEAASFLERARFFYRMTQNDRSLAALCCIDLAELAHVQCRLSVAERYLQAAETSLSSTAAPNPSVVARFHWMQASVLAALGAASQAIHHAQIAVALYETLKDVLSQLRCLATLAEAAVAAGDLELAASQIAVARSLFAAAVIPLRACAHILNVEVHLAWQSGNLAQAASAAEQLLRCCQDIPDRCLYSTALSGHLARERGDWAAADSCYAAAARLAVKHGYLDYLSELAIHRAWRHVLAGELASARGLVQASAAQMTRAQWMAANVVLAVTALRGEGMGSGDLLTTVLAYAMENGAGPLVCAVRCYLALTAFREGETNGGKEHGAAALRWLNEHNLDYFAGWWHPALMAEFVGQALRHCAEYSHVLQRICVNRLGFVAIVPLAPLREDADLAVRRRVQEIFALMGGQESVLEYVPDAYLRAVLTELVAARKLRRGGLSQLIELLTTAEQQRKPNAMLLAVFGLYLDGQSRGAIAERLRCSEKSVKNYISEIYARFGLLQVEYPERKVRFARLRALAQDAGFI
ncbi:MAG: LuxR C-terminal-related transcriptional regulator, partial [Caldilinea sp.]